MNTRKHPTLAACFLGAATGLSALAAGGAFAAQPHPGEAPYRKICVACHDKNASDVAAQGAPRLSNMQAWAILRKKGVDALASAVITPPTGKKPMPRGDLSEAEIKAAVTYMLHQSDPKTHVQNLGERRGMPSLD